MPRAAFVRFGRFSTPPAKAWTNISGIVSGKGYGSGIWRYLAGNAGISGHAQDHGRSVDRRRQPCVVGRKPTEARDGCRLPRVVHQGSQKDFRRKPIRFGEDHVERDRCGSGGDELRHEVCKFCSWPWPLADLRERGFVDRDDAHRKRRVDLTRRRAEVGVESGEPETRHRLGVCDAQCETGREQCDGDEQSEWQTAQSSIHRPASIGWANLSSEE